MKIRKRLIGALLTFSVTLGLISGCRTAPTTTNSSEAGGFKAPLKLASPAYTGAPIRIATFNIANLSVNKLTNKPVADQLVALVRKYDVIAVQELDDSSLNAPAAFLAKINAAPGDRYQVAASPEVGTTATDGQREQYAFYYNASRIESLDSGTVFPDSADDFVREPYMIHLRQRGAATSFVLLTVHTAPEKAPQEIAALRKASDWAANHYVGEEGVIILGDFNAGKRYTPLTAIGSIRTRDLPYQWIVPDDADTTLGAEPQAHDRIIVTGALRGRFTNTWGVDRAFTDKRVSDHFPVYAEFMFAGKN